MNKLKIGLFLLFSSFTASFAIAANDANQYASIKSAIEKNTPVYTDAYAKNVKGITYGLEMQNGFIVPPKENLGYTSRKSFDGNKLLGYFQPGTDIVFYVNGQSNRQYPVSEKAEHVFEVGNATITLKFETKDLPILPSSNMIVDDPSFYSNAKVYFVTMDMAPLTIKVETAKEQEQPKEWFDPTLRYNYVQDVKALKNQYLSGVNLDTLDDKELEYLARKMHAERRELGIKFKAATPDHYRKKIYKRNLSKYGDQYGPTISYLRNVQGKSWKEIINSATVPGGGDLWYTGVSYKLGEWRHKIGSFFSGNKKESL